MSDDEKRRLYEPCGFMHGYDFSDDCGWCWVLRGQTEDAHYAEKETLL